MNGERRRIAVIGGGITGLAAVHRLLELDPHCRPVLYEAAGRLGGILETQRRDGCLIERSADMFTTRDPWALDLCRRIGFDSQLLDTNKVNRRAFVLSRGRLTPVPDGMALLGPAKVWPILRTPLLSCRGKLRMAAEYFVPRRRESTDESLRDFSVRRFGVEAYERLIQPLIGGIYTADPTRLSMQATMAQFVDMERESGGLIRGMRRQARAARSGAGAAPGTGGQASQRGASVDPGASGARYGLFVAPKDGMSSLIDALAAKIEPAATVRLKSPVERLERLSADDGGGWRVVAGGAGETFDGLVLALPAPQAAPLASSFDSDLGRRLGAIEYAGAAVVVGLFRRDQFTRPVDGFGFVVPIVEGRKILSTSFASAKFPGRAPADRVIVRVFVGGATQPELLKLDDESVRKLAWDELGDLLGLAGRPEFDDVVRWDSRMPQYHVGHVERIAQIEAAASRHPTLALAGNAYHGVGIPFCVRSGEQAAASLLRRLASG